MSWRRGIWLLFVLSALRVELFAQTEVFFSQPGGFYNESFALFLSCNDWERQIRYTTNGDTPTANSKLYEAPLFLDEHLYSTSDIYTLPIAPVFEPYEPDSVRHAIVIRAAAFDDEGHRITDVVTHTYFIHSLGCDHHGLAVVSVCCDSLSLFDYDTGIFMPGALFDPDYPDWTGNYYEHGIEWERLANVEFYLPHGESVNQQCGLRTHGNRARKAYAKGMKLYAREEYGKKRFKGHFFETTQIKSFKHLVLKPFSTLWPGTGVQDYVANRMALELGLEAANSRPVVVYLNGEYWGIYFLQEKLDDHYLEDHFAIAPEKCNILCGNGFEGQKWVLEEESGDCSQFLQLLDWLEDADLSDSLNYAHVCSIIDIDNYIDYQILETFIANADWPANNMRCWQAGDNKWHFIFFDGDDALLKEDYDVFGNACYGPNDRWHTGGKSTLLFRRLLENNGFKLKFRERIYDLCASNLLFETVSPYLENIVSTLEPEIPNQVHRFGNPLTYDYWNWGVSLVRDFLQDRVEDYLNVYEAYEPCKIHDYQSNTDDFVIYPNPSEDVVYIKMLDGRSRETKFMLCDVMGRVILGGKSYLSACQEIVLGSELRSGVYVVKIGPYAHRFVKY